MREAVWGDFVPLGFFATWSCEPNMTYEEFIAWFHKLTGKNLYELV